MREAVYYLMVFLFAYIYFQFIEPTIVIPIIKNALANVVGQISAKGKEEYLSQIDFIIDLLRITLIVSMFGVVFWWIKRATRREPNEQWQY